MNSPTPALPARDLPALTGIRFLAALQVVCFHFGSNALPGSWAPFVQTGYVGVSLFYVLSGFILAFTYGRPNAPQPVAFKPFVIARLARVYPVYLLGLLLLLPFALFGKGGQPGVLDAHKFVAHLFAVQAWVPDWLASWNEPGWSISAEIFFYLCFPFLLSRIIALTPRQRIAVAILFWAAGMLPTVGYYFFNPDGLLFSPDRSSLAFWLSVVKFWPLMRLPEFVIGVVIGTVFVREELRPASRSGSGLTLFALTGIIATFAFHESVPYLLLHNALLAPLYAMLILGLSRGGFVATLFGRNPWTALGRASYAFYILHAPLAWYWPRLRGRDLGSETFAGFLAYLALLTVVALLTFRFVEDPARHWIRRRFAPSRS